MKTEAMGQAMPVFDNCQHASESVMNETRADTRRGVGISFTIALLGRRDQPTDAVEDYCRLLGGAFKERGVDFTLQRVAWNEIGWPL